MLIEMVFRSRVGKWAAEVVKLLLDAGADPNVRNIHRETLLYRAVVRTFRWSNHQEVKLLLDAGADPNKPNSD